MTGAKALGQRAPEMPRGILAAGEFYRCDLEGTLERHTYYLQKVSKFTAYFYLRVTKSGLSRFQNEIRSQIPCGE